MADGGVIQEQLCRALESLMHRLHQPHLTTVPALIRNVPEIRALPPPRPLAGLGMMNAAGLKCQNQPENAAKTLKTALGMQKMILLGAPLKPRVIER